MRIGICDDNPEDLALYSEKIWKIADKIGEPVEMVKYQNAKQLLFAMEDAKDAADLLFLDIHMPEQNGIDLARQLRERGYRKDIVFLTVSKKHALPAFDVGAFNYIIKNNTTEERFEQVVAAALGEAKKKSSVFMLFSAGGENRSVAVSDILYFEVVNRIIAVHYGQETFEFFSTIGKLENKLRNYGFVRIHRSILLAKAYIRSFSNEGVVLRNGEILPVSRGNYAKLKEAMEEERII